MTVAGTLTMLLDTTSDPFASVGASTATLGVIVIGLLVTTSGFTPSSCLLFLMAPLISCSSPTLEKTGIVLPLEALLVLVLVTLTDVSSSSPSGVSPSMAPTVTLEILTVDLVVL